MSQTTRGFTSKSPANSPNFAYLDIDGMTIRYKAAGVGEQVLLLHGWGGSIESMEFVFDDLAAHYAVVALDFPGHGESQLPPTAWGVSEYTEIVLRIMDVLHFQRPHIIAHSFGGRVTIKLAVIAPERVGKIILINSAGVRPSRKLHYYVRVFFAKTGKYMARYCGRLGAYARDSIYTVMSSRDYANAGPRRETFVRIVNEDLTPILTHIKSPVLLVWGEHDEEVPLSSAKLMAQLIPTAELVVLKHAGHFSYIDQYGKFRLLAARFLRA